MKCPFCSKNENKDVMIKEIRMQDVHEHLIVTKDVEGHIHVHGPVSDKTLIVDMIKKIAREAGLDLETE